MAEKYFKYLVFVFFGISILAVFSGFFSSSDEYDVNVTQMISADKGLDLKAVGAILQTAKNGKDFEVKLNSSDSGVNNLDLNEDGKVDYINVTEFGEENIKGFALSTKLDNNEVQELASIKVEKKGEKDAKVEVKGNEAVYGPNHYHQTSWGGGGFVNGLMMGYLFSSFNRPWGSPWGGGSYPPSYRSYPPVSQDSYQRNRESLTRDSRYLSTNRGQIGGMSSPYANKNASGVKAPLKNPTVSQKSFQKRNPSKQVKVSGFGRRKSGSFGRSSGFGRRSSVRGFGRSGGFFRGK